MSPFPHRLASLQHGNVTAEQLHDAGVDAERIKRLRRSGWLRPRHRGVYGVGHDAPSRLGECMAAVLAAGSGAVLSHLSAAELHRLISWRAGRIETIVEASGRQRPCFDIHKGALPAADVTRHRRIPTTTVPRTLLDIATRLDGEALTQAVHEAWVLHRTTRQMIEACLARHPGKPGGPALRSAMGADVTLSMLERAFLRLLRAHGLPRPRTNVDVAGDKVDCHWAELGLTVELHSFRYHATRRQFEIDLARRRRSRHLMFSWGDITERGEQTIAELAPLLRPRAA